MNDVIVRIQHLRAAGMCSRQPREWFKKHGLNWTVFVTDGYPASVLRATGDQIVERVIEKAEADGR